MSTVCRRLVAMGALGVGRAPHSDWPADARVEPVELALAVVHVHEELRERYSPA